MNPPGRRRRRAILLAAVPLLSAAILLSARSLALRLEWEADRIVELCLDADEIRPLCDYDDRRTTEALERLAEAGVTTLAVYWNPVVPLVGVLNEWAERLPETMSLTLRPQVDPFSGWSGRWPKALPESERVGPPMIRHLLFAGPSVPGRPDLEPARAFVSRSSWTLPSLEFSRQKGLRDFLGGFPERCVRAHGLSETEMSVEDPARVIERLRRAVRERGVRFVYVRLFPDLSWDRNRDFVNELVKALRRDGYRVGSVEGRAGRWGRRLGAPWPRVRQFLALLTALAAPSIAFMFLLGVGRPGDAAAALVSRYPLPGILRRRWPGISRAAARLVDALNHPLFRPTAATAIVGGAGFLIAGFLSVPSFALGLDGFRGVHVAMIGPLLIGAYWLYPRDELMTGLHRPLSLGRVLAVMTVFGFVFYLLSRGGGPMPAPGESERRLRLGLESIFGVRPRFKEFLFGHPLLWLGFYLRHHPIPRRWADGAPRIVAELSTLFADPRPLLLGGMIAWVSVINSFCQPHVPVVVSLARSIHGLWLGCVIGAIAVVLLRRVVVRWADDAPLD
jgi:hypothetical protein